MTSAEHLRAVLAVVGDGVGCEHWTLPEHGLPVALLEALGCARPIRTRVPRCSEHGCRYLGACEQQVVFEEEREGRAGRKFRLTPEARRATSDPALRAAFLSAAAALPLAEQVRAALVDGPRTLFELNWALVEPHVAALGAGAEPAPLPSRAYLRATLALLAEQGIVEIDTAAGVVRLSATRHGSDPDRAPAAGSA